MPPDQGTDAAHSGRRRAKFGGSKSFLSVDETMSKPFFESYEIGRKQSSASIMRWSNNGVRSCASRLLLS